MRAELGDRSSIVSGSLTTLGHPLLKQTLNAPSSPPPVNLDKSKISLLKLPCSGRPQTQRKAKQGFSVEEQLKEQDGCKEQFKDTCQLSWHWSAHWQERDWLVTPIKGQAFPLGSREATGDRRRQQRRIKSSEDKTGKKLG